MNIEKYKFIPRNLYRNRQLNEFQSCVYFFIKNHEVVYIGKTVDLTRRLKNHRKNGKTYTYVEYINVPHKLALFIEYYFIRMYTPKYNKEFEPPRGIGNIHNLKKTSSTTSETLGNFIKIYNPIIFAIIDGENYYLQDDIEKKWCEIYGSYRILKKKIS